MGAPTFLQWEVCMKVVPPKKWPSQMMCWEKNKKKLLKGIKLWVTKGKKPGYHRFKFNDTQYAIYVFRYETPKGLWGVTLWDSKRQYVAQCELKETKHWAR